MQEGSSLNVSGASAGSSLVGVFDSSGGGNGGGGGGVIQVLAYKVTLRNMLLAGGISTNCTFALDKLAKEGVFILKSKIFKLIGCCCNRENICWSWDVSNCVF